MSDVSVDDCAFHGYIRWYAAAAGSLLPLSHLPILEPDSYRVDVRDWTVWSLASYDGQGWIAAVGANLMLILVVVLAVTSFQPALHSGRRVVAVAAVAASLTATLLAVAATTDKALTGTGLAAAAVLLVTAVLAVDHALHLTFRRRRTGGIRPRTGQRGTE